MKLISNALTLFIIAALAVMMFHGKPNTTTRVRHVVSCGPSTTRGRRAA
jgi:hypothetical protein